MENIGWYEKALFYFICNVDGENICVTNLGITINDNTIDYAEICRSPKTKQWGVSLVSGDTNDPFSKWYYREDFNDNTFEDMCEKIFKEYKMPIDLYHK